MTVLTLVSGNSILVNKRLPSSAGNRCRYQIANSTDVVSVQPDGTIQKRPSNADGAWEQFYESADGYTSVDLQRDGIGFSGKLVGDPL